MVRIKADRKVIMKNLFKFVFAAIAVLFAFVANAQSIGRQPVVMGSGQSPNAPWGAPQVAYNGGGYGNGTSVSYYNQQASYGGQPLPAVGTRYGDEVLVGYEPRQVTVPCDYQERDAQMLMLELLGGGIGQAVDHHAKGTLIGAFAARLFGQAFVPCTKQVTVRVPITRPVTNVGLQQAAYHEQRVSKPATCTIDDSRLGIIKVIVRDDEDCDALAKKASLTKTVTAQNTAPTQESAAPKTAETGSECKNICVRGKRAEKLNWPGHPQHGKCVCIPDGEKNDGPR